MSSGFSRIGERLFVALQYFLPQHATTRLIGWFMSRRTPWLKDTQIKVFSKMFNVATAEAAKPVPDGYASMNEFFTRELAEGARTVAADAVIASPCDGVISELGEIEDGQLIQAKGFRYSVAELTGDPAATERYRGGRFMTIYLAPYDYHRVHFPVAGHVSSERHVPGKLFSVNGATANAVPRLFARNERRVFLIDADSNPLSLIMVGALNVGSISTAWETSPTPAGFLDTPTLLAPPATHFDQGDTLGWFNMGSTVILLLEEDSPAWRDDLAKNTAVRCGERLNASTQ
ncbi:MAG: archaetidylserine decarboxylase [Pseudomonadota bacterium]